MKPRQMVNTIAEHWHEMMAHPWEVIVWAYVLIGFGVWIYLRFRLRLTRRSPDDPFPWPRRQNPQQGLNLFFRLGAYNPILFIAQVTLWPLCLLFLWAIKFDIDTKDD